MDSLEFSFDSQVINSKAYRRALADAKRRAEPESAAEKSTSTTDPQGISNVIAGLGTEDNSKVTGPSSPAKLPNNDNSPLYICMTCQRSHARVEYLKRHERSHMKEQPLEVTPSDWALQHKKEKEADVMLSLLLQSQKANRISG